MKRTICLILAFAGIFIIACNNPKKVSKEISTIQDIEGNVYKTVKIGKQVWIAENLRTTKYNDGTAIPMVTDNTTWLDLTTPAYCFYRINSEIVNKIKYGALYNWFTVSTNKLCPAGWHVPTDTDWTTLITYLGGDSVAGGKLKEVGTTDWDSPNAGATNETGFTALPSGSCTDRFYNSGMFSYWWSATEFDAKAARYRYMSFNDSDVDRGYTNKLVGFSVRCVKDK